MGEDEESVEKENKLLEKKIDKMMSEGSSDYEILKNLLQDKETKI
jgi:hypothetical protein